MTEKVVNYTDEMVTRLHEVYDGEASVDERKAQVARLAEELGKSAASIRAKLTREGLYVPIGKPEGKTGGVRKAHLVTAIANELDVDEDVVGSLEKATKVALERVLRALRSE